MCDALCKYVVENQTELTVTKWERWFRAERRIPLSVTVTQIRIWEAVDLKMFDLEQFSWIILKKPKAKLMNRTFYPLMAWLVVINNLLDWVNDGS